jgi:hypothetical protein
MDWIHQREQAQWNEQIDRDSASGRLDFLSEEAVAESKKNLVLGWPPLK